jgi:predicted homoserine dehydrogenase-like protein
MSKNTHEIDAYVRPVNKERTIVDTKPLAPGSAVTQNQIRVGIIGANAKRGWAKVPHIPAINGIPGLKLAAVATRNEESARLAAAVLISGIPIHS